MRIMQRIIVTVTALALAACGGGTSGVAPSTNASHAANPQRVQVMFHIVVPAKTTSARARRPQYISADTASASITVNGGLAQTGTCTSVTCDVLVDAPVGSDTFAVQLLDSSSHVLSAGSTSQSISGTIANTVNIAFGGVPKTANFTADHLYLAPGTLTQTSDITVTVLDAAGDTIIGSDPFVDASGNPLTITLADSDSTGNTTLSPINFTNPSLTPTLTYTGASALAGTTISIGGSAVGLTSNGIAIHVYNHHDFVEYPVAAGPDAITTGSDGNIWFGEEGGHHIGFVTVYGGVTELSPPTNTDITGITSGPDGNIWFTEQLAGNVGRVQIPGHAMSEFSVGGAPLGIATGFDGALWFADFSGSGAIGRITTSGSFQSYSGFASTQDEGVALGPDHRIWITAAFPAGSDVGAVTTAGVVSSYSTGSGTQGRGIVAGPDGEMWFADDGNSQVHKIHTDGTGYTSYNTALASADPVDITVGADNNLWTAEIGGGIARVTTAGVFTEFTVPTSNSAPRAITAGPDGNIWFTEEIGNKIGRFIL